MFKIIDDKQVADELWKAGVTVTMQPITDPKLADELQQMGLLWWWHNQRWELDSVIEYDKPSSSFDIHTFAIRVEE